MVNTYPWWKYLLISIVVSFGVVYSIPNLYPPDAAIQITGASASLEMDESVVEQVIAVLDKAGIEHIGSEIQKSSVLVRLKDKEQQLAAKSALEGRDGLQGQYVVALNLAPTTPEWLQSIGASPMKLGLDLSGGVHFLLEVNTSDLIGKRVEDYSQQIRSAIREAKISSRDWQMTTDGDRINLRFESEELLKEAKTLIRETLSSFVVQDDVTTDFGVILTLSESATDEIVNYAVSQNLTALRNRVNELGVSEPVVQRQGKNRIVVELPGVQDTATAKKIIGKTANLEFRLEAEPEVLRSRKEEYAFRNSPQRTAWLERSIILTGDRVTAAQSNFDPETGSPQVNITLDTLGGKLMNRATRNNVGRRMGVLFIESRTEKFDAPDESGKIVQQHKTVEDKNLINLATIQSPLGVQFRITGLDSPAEASELALLLRAGALAAHMDFVEERTIGPSLGAENIRMGIFSVQVGMALVLFFMILVYRVFGLAANLALVANIVLLVACMSIIGATLTLPGIAGIVLTVGMAVDANVLIFARIKEELAAGLSPQMAIDSGFDRAFVTILDANITTLLVALILYAVGTGPIQGFAVTLSIGILTSMFTAIMLTRSIINLVYGGRKVEKLWI
ncbi:MAG: protein translocase subunit SecD [Pseudomonadales bacterium]|nr:protein translocase subunit SecD [Pseudomonadales bacterium]